MSRSNDLKLLMEQDVFLLKKSVLIFYKANLGQRLCIPRLSPGEHPYVVALLMLSRKANTTVVR
jgi:hypothetical protein